jgi:hypothetical protein
MVSINIPPTAGSKEDSERSFVAWRSGSAFFPMRCFPSHASLFTVALLPRTHGMTLLRGQERVDTEKQ